MEWSNSDAMSNIQLYSRKQEARGVIGINLQVLQIDSRLQILLVSLNVATPAACPCKPQASSACCSSLVAVYPCQLSDHL
jgi:hypothetical protein